MKKTIVIVAIALAIIIILSALLLYWKHVSVQHQQNQIQQEQLIQEIVTSSDAVLVSNNTSINPELVKQESMLVDHQNDKIKLCYDAVVGEGNTGNVEAKSCRPKRSKMPEIKGNKTMPWMSLSKINKDLIDNKGKFFMLICRYFVQI